MGLPFYASFRGSTFLPFLMNALWQNLVHSANGFEPVTVFRPHVLKPMHVIYVYFYYIAYI